MALHEAISLRSGKATISLRLRVFGCKETCQAEAEADSQVMEVNQMFRDLACIVTEQGAQFETIEQQALNSSANTKQAVKELKKAAERQRSQRERQRSTSEPLSFTNHRVPRCTSRQSSCRVPKVRVCPPRGLPCDKMHAILTLLSAVF